MAVEQLAHRRAEPRRDVGAVGHVRDRHLVDRPVGPQVVPHLARDLAVALGDAVGDPARAQRELGHAERLRLLVGVRAAAPHELVRIDAQLGREPGQRLRHLRGRIGVVAGRHRRVGREHGPPPDGLERVLERAAGRLALGARQLQARERRVALVEVHDAGIDPERVQRAHAADPEHRVLAEPHAGIADVQPRRDPAVGQVVLRPVGVEQQQRHAADVDAPDLRDHLAVADRHRHGDRLAVRARHQRSGHAMRIGLDPVLVLPAGRVDPLAEVAVAVHQADRDEREPHVRGLLEDVARQHAETAGVDRQRLVDRELGAEERSRAVLGHRLGQERLVEPLVDRRLQRGDARGGSPRRRRAGRACRAAPLRAAGRGCRGTAPSALGRSRREAPGRRASTTSGSCRRCPRGRRAAREGASGGRPRPR